MVKATIPYFLMAGLLGAAAQRAANPTTETRNEVSDIQPGQTFRDCPDCPEMVEIPAGTYMIVLLRVSQVVLRKKGHSDG